MYLSVCVSALGMRALALVLARKHHRTDARPPPHRSAAVRTHAHGHLVRVRVRVRGRGRGKGRARARGRDAHGYRPRAAAAAEAALLAAQDCAEAAGEALIEGFVDLADLIR